MSAIDDLLSDVQTKSANVDYSSVYASNHQAIMDLGVLTHSIVALLTEMVTEEDALNTSEFPPPTDPPSGP